MSQKKSWTCTGVPLEKYRDQYPEFPHTSEENTDDFCKYCALPREAVIEEIIKPPPNPIKVIGIILGIAFLGGAGFGIWHWTSAEKESGGEEEEVITIIKSPLSTLNTPNLVSRNAKQPALISQGETILLPLEPRSQKDTGAYAFGQGYWDGAIEAYRQAINDNRNDPEAKIYLNNAKAAKNGNVMTMAVVVPITSSQNEAQEVLRGVAQYQDEYNEKMPSQFLEVVLVNEERSNLSQALAQDLIQATQVLGVLGHGVDNNSREALELYEQNQMAVLSTLNTIINKQGNQSIVKTISVGQTDVLLNTYLSKVGKTLVNYAIKNHYPSQVAVFYNSDSSYSQKLKNEFVKEIQQTNGRIVQEIDVTSTGFRADSAIDQVIGAGANIAFLALSNDHVKTAVDLAQANRNELVLLGGNELYNPTLLIAGGSAIEGIVLAVPWQWRDTDEFATQAAKLWQGRISWRTATTYDATQALVQAFNQHPGNRAAIAQALNQGITLTTSATEFDIVNDIPLVKAVPGPDGPQRSNYQFDPVPLN